MQQNQLENYEALQTAYGFNVSKAQRLKQVIINQPAGTAFNNEHGVNAALMEQLRRAVS